VEYCKMDVKLTYEIWKLGKDQKFLVYEHKQTKDLVKCPVTW